MNSPKVAFIPVRDTLTKLHAITLCAQNHFVLGKRLLISVANDAAAQYIDELLWKQPIEGFLPHAFLNNPSNESILITTSFKNLNNAFFLLNLCPEVHPLASSFALTYELYDETQAIKLDQSEKRKKLYLEENFSFLPPEEINSFLKHYS